MRKQWVAGLVLVCAISMGTGRASAYVRAEITQDGENTEKPEDGLGDGSNGTDQPGDNVNPGDSQEPDQPDDVVDQFEIDQMAWEMAVLNDTYLRCAKTVQRQLFIDMIPEETSAYTVTWKSSNSKIASVDSKGKVTAVGTGEAFITCIVKTESGFEKRLICEIEVTNPKLKKTTYAVAKGTKIKIDISGTETTVIQAVSKNTAIAKTYKSEPGIVKGIKEGKTKVQVTVDGKVLECTIVVSNPKLKKKLFVMTTSQSDAINIYNQSGLEKVKYTSSKPSVATVSSTGKIKTLKVGVSVIKATVDNKTFEITVSVGKKNAAAAIKNAQKALGYKYSQPKRMWKYYRDCSSLVWRSYAPVGYLFGYSKNASNAPTAAGECYYLVKNNREVAKSYVSESKLRPGDLIFISTGYNGRYKNISHVAIYIGNDIIIHATPRNTNDVQYGTMSYYKNKIVSIGRPVK